MDDGDIVLR